MFIQRMVVFGQNSPNTNPFVGYARETMTHIALCLLVLSSELGGLHEVTVIAAAIWTRSLLIAEVNLSKALERLREVLVFLEDGFKPQVKSS